MASSQFFFHLLSQWMDLIWIPIAFFVLHKDQRIKGIIYILLCAFVMRLQVELIESTGYVTGFLPVLHNSLLQRGMITYSVFHAFFLIISYYSPRTNAYIYMGAALTIFITAFCVSGLIMIL